MGRKYKGSTEEEVKEKIINGDNKEHNLKDVRSSKGQKTNRVTRNEDIYG